MRRVGITALKTPKGPIELALPLQLFRYLFPRLGQKQRQKRLNDGAGNIRFATTAIGRIRHFIGLCGTARICPIAE